MRADTALAGQFLVACRSRRGGERWRAVVANGVTTAACDEFNRLMFTGAAAVARTWTLRLIDAAGFTGLDPTDTLAAHPGWVEYAGYTPYAPTWTQTAAVEGVIDSLTTLSVTVGTAGSLKGIYLAASSLLYSTGELATARVVSPGDVLSLRYRVTARPRAGT